MVRLVPFKNTNLTDAKAKMTLGMSVEEDGIRTNKFYNLELELDAINALTLSWTLVHPITENSPFYNFTEDDFKKNHVEILVFITTFDDMFSNTVAARTSYTFNEIIYGAKFETMYNRSEDGTKTILYLDLINQFHTTKFS